MDSREILKNQQYHFAGKHAAVKICRWTKNSIRGDGHCYKQEFYGIESHRCVQMSPAVGHCHNRCVFCWRPIELTEGIVMEDYDEPADIIDGCLKGQKVLLSGFGGNYKAVVQKLEESRNPKHFAISLSGEPLLYPKLSELIRLLHKGGYTSFVVTNGLEPDALAQLEPPTQLYLSVDAPTKELFEKIDRPAVTDGWERLQRSLKLFPELGKKTRTCLRFTIIKDLNMDNPEGWAQIIKQAKPWFVEVKAYMHVGFSKKRLGMENMPLHQDIVAFAKEIAAHCGYEFTAEHARSRVALLVAPWVKEIRLADPE